jgi:hypothetical protein
MRRRPIKRVSQGSRLYFSGHPSALMDWSLGFKGDVMTQARILSMVSAALLVSAPGVNAGVTATLHPSGAIVRHVHGA